MLGKTSKHSFSFRLANIAIDMTLNKMWKLVNETRKAYMESFTSTSNCLMGAIPAGDISALVKSIEDQLGRKADTTIVEGSWGNDDLRPSAEMFLYLSFCPPKVEMDAVRKELEQSMKIYAPKEILIILNRLLHAKGRNLPYRKEFSTFLDRLRKAWNLRYQQINNLKTEVQCKDCNITENQNLYATTNHPVHILDENSTFTQSSFIPFCWFGDHLEISTMSERFNVSVCNSFKPKLRNDQVCYEMDPNELLRGQTADNKVLYFVTDENRDRQISTAATDEAIGMFPMPRSGKKQFSFMLDDVKLSESVIYLDTIGDHINI